MKRKIFFLILVFSIFYFLFYGIFVFAQKLLGEDFSCIGTGDCQLIDILKLGRAITKFILKYLGVLALIFFIVGGIIWITSSGNPERVKQGKHILVGTLIGVVIVLFAWQIVNLVICAISQGQIQETCTIFGNQKWNVFPQ